MHTIISWTRAFTARRARMISVGAKAIATPVFVLAIAAISGKADPPILHDAFDTTGTTPALTNWHQPWSRDAGKIRAVSDERVRREGASSLRLEHTGARDWSLTPKLEQHVQAGELYELTAALRVAGEGVAQLSFVTYDATGGVTDWSACEATVHEANDWRELRTRILIDESTAKIVPRFIGSGTATVWIDDLRFSRVPLAASDTTPLAKVTVTNGHLLATFDPTRAAFTFADLTTGRLWTQHRADADLVVTSVAVRGSAIEVGLLRVSDDLAVHASLSLDPATPEALMTVSADGPLSRPLAWPPPFVSPAGARIVVPMNEGIAYPADDASIPPMRLICYGGHGICMPFWGVDDAGCAAMTLVETPDDASFRMTRRDGRLAAGPEWDAQKGRFGYARKLRVILLPSGGHVAMCKRYRAYAKATGLLKTLTEKRRKNPNVDLLIGAANVWCWDRNATGMVAELQAAGIQRILWSAGGKAETVRALNATPDVLTSRYDIYQDLMDPAVVSTKLTWTHGDWTQDGWPKDIMRGADGAWVRGWEVRGRDGVMYPCGVLCDRQAVPYAERRIPAELKDRPFRARFIDTTTASPWRECYDPAHPMTRSDSREWKMKLLAYISGPCGLVTGSETGHDASVPYVHYFEGMLSLGPYRVGDAGRNMQQIVTDVPERVAKFQLGHRYRLPLWELVYHDCVVAHWYWGDYNNKLPALWDKRDLFNALYGTAPMFMFDRSLWNQQRDRFVRSYRTIEPVARGAGYAEMTDHRWLTADGDVQQTRFANGLTVTANFSDGPYAGPPQVPPLSVVVEN